ncbi:MAG: hypothetical protein OXH11_19690, partial [Candidatus Aminicenantes bacterium]|nr:hypothetical protein [Candidatus Aminicenantes bacterium]
VEMIHYESTPVSAVLELVVNVMRRRFGGRILEFRYRGQQCLGDFRFERPASATRTRRQKIHQTFIPDDDPEDLPWDLARDRQSARLGRAKVQKGIAQGEIKKVPTRPVELRSDRGRSIHRPAEARTIGRPLQ